MTGQGPGILPTAQAGPRDPSKKNGSKLLVFSRLRQQDALHALHLRFCTVSALLARARKRFAPIFSSSLGEEGSYDRTNPSEPLFPTRVLGFALSFVLLNLCVNATWFHLQLPIWSLFLPSFEILGWTLVLAFMQGRGLRVSFPIRLGLTVLLVSVVVLQLIDIGVRHFMRLELDVNQVLHLAPEFVRLGFSTLPLWKFSLVAVLVLGILAGLGLMIWKALRANERALAYPQLRRAFYKMTAVLGCIAALSALVSSPALAHRQFGVFAPPSFPKLVSAGRRWWHADEYVAQLRARVDQQRTQFESVPATFGRLRGRAVHLVFIESYGMSVFSRGEYQAELASDYERAADRLAQAGFQIRSAQLRSPTFGGQSWLAHGTLSTGLKLESHTDHTLVFAADPVTLGGLFSAAGYHTVGVWPGTTRNVTQHDRRGFREVIASFDMGYLGPKYGWAPMPDQYVLDFARRRLAKRTGPRFVEYALVSSHMPFSPRPRYVEDWESLGDGGALYRSQEPVDYGVNLPDLSKASHAYLGCIGYDLRVLTQYIAEYGERDGLFIVLGDHQPLADVAGADATHDVPIHVISQEADLLAPFEARGYVPGWAPESGAPAAPMEGFLAAFLQDFGPAE